MPVGQDENNRSMNSSNLETLQSLARRIDRGEAERFLVELLNLRSEDQGAVRRFGQMFEDYVPYRPIRMPMRMSATQEEREAAVNAANAARPIHNTRSFDGLKSRLKDAWVQPTALAREVAVLGVLHEALNAYLRKGEVHTEEAHQKRHRAYGNIVLTLLHAERIVDRMRYCPNPHCGAPHFIARRRSQKYCSDACSLPAQREFKRAWWDEHGKGWRAERKKMTQKSRKLARLSKKGDK